MLSSHIYSYELSLCVKSCLDMKNYEAVFVLVEALDRQRNQGSWQVS